MARRTIPYLLRATLRTDVGVDVRAFPFDIPAVRDIGEIVFHPNVTFLVGESGVGKSTLLDAIARAVGLGGEGGGIDTAGGRASLHDVLRVTRGVPKPRDARFIRVDDFCHAAAGGELPGYLPAYGRPPPQNTSRGEAFMAVLLNQLRGDGLYLMDEPEAALSPNRQLVALRAIHQLVEDHSQLVIATHSPILLAYPHARIYRLDDAGVAEVALEDTEAFAVLRDFLNHHPRRLAQLLGEDRSG